MFKSIRSNILVGLVLVTPLVVTAFVVNGLFTFITNRVLILLPRHLREEGHELYWRVAALLIVLTLLFVVGLLARNILGKKLYKFGDQLFSRIPLINRVYIAIRHIITSLFQQRKTLFQEAVLVEYPRPGAYAVGFITSVMPAEYASLVKSAQPGEPCVSVFIPTTPNPTSGWLAILPISSTQKLNMTSGEAMQLVVSGGVVYPGLQSQSAPPSLVELVHELTHEARETSASNPNTP